MIFLITAILTSTLIIIFFKFYKKFRIDTVFSLTINYLVAVILGFSMDRDAFAAAADIHQQPWFYWSLLSGVLLIATFFAYSYSVQKAGLAITGVSGKMSVVIPVMTGFFIFHETAGWLKIFGIILALLAFYLTLKKSGEKKQVTKAGYLLLPVLVFLGNGLNDSIFNISHELYIQQDHIIYLTFAFGASLMIGIIISIFKMIIYKKIPDLRSITAGIILGIMNWFSTWLFLKGLGHFDVSVFVPVFNASLIVLASLSGLLFFREKMSKINIAGLILTVIAIVLISL